MGWVRLNFASLVSVALALSVFAAALLSTRYRVLVDWTARSHRVNYNVRLVHGEFMLISISQDPPYEPLPWRAGWSVKVTRVVPADNLRYWSFRLLGIGYYASESAGAGTRMFAVPAWIVGLTFAFPAVISTWRVIRANRRKRHGLCDRCGYDLRGSKGKCPECGKPITSNTTTKMG